MTTTASEAMANNREIYPTDGEAYLPPDLEARLSTTPDVLLSGWWVRLNRWEWPDPLAEWREEPTQFHLARRWAIMCWIANRVGPRSIRQAQARYDADRLSAAEAEIRTPGRISSAIQRLGRAMLPGGG